MKIDGDTITFSSGRTTYANYGIIGISPDLSLFGGYDGSIDWPVPDWWQPEAKVGKLTSDDMRELADHMIATWTKFKETLDK